MPRQAMSLGDTIRHGAAWMFVGNSGRQILGFLFGIVLARLLVPVDRGRRAVNDPGFCLAVLADE